MTFILLGISINEENTGSKITDHGNENTEADFLNEPQQTEENGKIAAVIVHSIYGTNFI